MIDEPEYEMHVPVGFKAYPRLAEMCEKMPPTGTVMEELFSDPGERARASQALSLLNTELLKLYLPAAFDPRFAGTPFWHVLIETISEASVRAMALGVYLGQTGTGKLKLEDR